jgi:hypothetical protein
MKKIITLASALAAFVVLGAGCSGSVGTVKNTSNTKIYNNTENSFSVTYPDSWTLKEGVAGTVAAFVSPQRVDDDFADNITVVVKPTTATVNDYVASAINSAPKSYDEFKLIKDEPATLGGEEAEMVTYTFTEGDLKPYTREIFAVKNGTLYDITFTAFQIFFLDR